MTVLIGSGLPSTMMLSFMNGSLSIYGVLKLYMLHLCGLAFGDDKGAKRALEWVSSDFQVGEVK